jgi:PAS domain S-box-containing protein
MVRLKPQQADHSGNKAQIVRIVLPPTLAIVFFSAAIFCVFLPALESSIVAKKREMLRELVQTAWNTLDIYHQMTKSGELTREQAQVSAIRHLRGQRYGPENKDYFWILNKQPRMIMHPYLTTLENKEMSDYRDAEGKQVIAEMVAVVRAAGEGYVDYLWQWKDDPGRIGKKLSYVKEFEPWQWIVGTGVYLDELEIEITALRWKLLKISLMILGFVTVLLVYVIHRGLKNEAERMQALEKIRSSEEHLRSVMTAVPDPVVVYDIQGRVTYLNLAFTRVFGWSLSEVEGRRIDFVPEAHASETLARVEETIKKGYCTGFETQRYTKEGLLIDVSISSARYRDETGEPLGIIINLHDVSEFKRTRKELEKHQAHLEEMVAVRTSALEKSLSEIKTLSGLLPICAACKKIRDDKGYWNQLEKYIHEHSEAQFSHSICPECAKQLYSDLDK